MHRLGGVCLGMGGRELMGGFHASCLGHDLISNYMSDNIS